nr:coat protein [Agapanthus velarivirus]QVY19210.1 coat protein [Agapanthus velarivirus]QVY47406.1 coat protein [Agapanthus velarivirus]
MDQLAQKFQDYINAVRRPVSSRSAAERAIVDEIEGLIMSFDGLDVATKEAFAKVVKPAQIPDSVADIYRNRLRTISEYVRPPSQGGSSGQNQSDFDFSQLPTDVKIHSQAADELSPGQVTLFNENLTKFIAQHMLKKTDPNAPLTPKEKAVGMASFYVAAAEQTTSMANANNKNLKNTFTLDGVDYTWNYGDAFKYFGAVFANEAVDNPIRRYMKAMYTQTELVLEKCGHQSSERMAAKWGVTSGNRRNIADYVPLHKARLTQDGMAAQHAATEYATSKRDGGGNKVHVMQTLGRSMRRY